MSSHTRPTDREPAEAGLAPVIETLTDLVIVHLPEPGAARRLLKKVVARLERRLSASAARQGSPFAFGIVVYTMNGDGDEGGWPEGARVIASGELLDPGRIRRANAAAYQRTKDLVQGEMGGVWPKLGGASLGLVNVLRIQRRLIDFEMLTELLDAALPYSVVRSCYVVAVDHQLAESVARKARRYRLRTTAHAPRLLRRVQQAWSLPLWGVGNKRLIERRARKLARSTATALGLEDIRSGILTISESVPISQMFEVVGQGLARLDAEALHLDLDWRGDSSSLPGRDGSRAKIPIRLPDRWWSRGAFRRSSRRIRREEQRAVGGRVGESLRLLQPTTRAMFARDFAQQSFHFWFLDELLSIVRPGVVVVGNDRYWSGQLVVHAARARAIPSICVQDGLAADTPAWWWSTADRIAAASELWARTLMERGLPNDRCVVTGQPRFDPVVHLADQPAAELRRLLSLSDDDFAVVFATQDNQRPPYQLEVAKAILEVEGVKLIFRPHPSEPSSRHEALLRELPDNRVFYCPGGRVVDLLRAADALVTQWSTVTVEAVLLAKPVVFALFSPLPSPIPFAERGVGIQANTAEELTGMIRALARRHSSDLPQSGEGTRTVTARASDYLGPTDGEAGRRVADLILASLHSSGLSDSAHRSPSISS